MNKTKECEDLRIDLKNSIHLNVKYRIIEHLEEEGRETYQMYSGKSMISGKFPIYRKRIQWGFGSLKKKILTMGT